MKKVLAILLAATLLPVGCDTGTAPELTVKQIRDMPLSQIADLVNCQNKEFEAETTEDEALDYNGELVKEVGTNVPKAIVAKWNDGYGPDDCTAIVVQG